jgi:hypothetical protein
LLVWRYGLAGPCYGFAIAQGLLFLGTWRLAHRVCPMPWFSALRPDRPAGMGQGAS